MAVRTAHYWRILPHEIWTYPFRYFKELRDAYLATLRPPPVETDEEDSIDWKSPDAQEKVIEFDRELFRGDAL